MSVAAWVLCLTYFQSMQAQPPLFLLTVRGKLSVFVWVVGAVFDSSTESASSINANGEAVEEMVTPARPRTTEDLFAAIHR